MKENNMMKNAIEFRLQSDSWDERIAESVMSRRSMKRERFLFPASVVSMAAASLSVIVLAANLYFSGIASGTESYESASYTYSADEYGSGNDAVASEISSLINEAYPMR